VKNFKAIRDSGIVKFTPLTVFIGNNGSGKSSLIEGLETYRRILSDGLDKAMEPAHGFEHLWNHGVKHEAITPGRGRPYQTNPMFFEVRCHTDLGHVHSTMEVTLGGGDALFIRDELVEWKWEHGPKPEDRKWQVYKRDATGHWNNRTDRRQLDGESIVEPVVGLYFDWQFFTFNPQTMGLLSPEQRAEGRGTKLLKDGSNIAAYLNSIYRTDPKAYDGIIEAVQHVLSYARELQPKITTELERNVYLLLRESEFVVPGWLLSTGTLRLVALLALLRHPKPPPLIVVEEIENGLDPRTVHLIVEEIRYAVERRRTQVVMTTHSPYLLDLLALEDIVLVERIEGQPTFSRPGDETSLKKWAKDFAPGQLYTMGRMKASVRR
jgi:predicted ATPase